MHPDAQGRAYTSAGDGLGLVLAGGTADGAWEARFCGKLMEVRLNMFERPGARSKKAVEERFGEVAAFLGARGVSFSCSRLWRERLHPLRPEAAIKSGGERHQRRGGRGVRALRSHGGAADTAPPRPEDAPQEQEEQKDLRPAGDPPHRRPLPALPPPHPHRPGQQRAGTRIQHPGSPQVPPGYPEVHSLDW